MLQGLGFIILLLTTAVEADSLMVYVVMAVVAVTLMWIGGRVDARKED